jgi:hypothetical protein
MLEENLDDYARNFNAYMLEGIPPTNDLEN